MSENSRNRLADEQSPYLLQHKENPVHWQPWDQTAFQRARDENKPIFLSIGYSTCHWCHVMEHESFEKTDVAEILNEKFISIKVDREERPDVDRLYMSFVQATTGQGGWPLSVWLTPELKPFAGGTYFPPEDNFGRPGFKSVLHKIAAAWNEEPEKLQEHGSRVVTALQTAEAGREAGSELDPAWIDHTFRRMLGEYDEREGGFGNAPKFPRPSLFHFLFRYASRPETAISEGVKAKQMALDSLRAMARGGMCDQIGGGFHRYSVDERWHVPHFEKMLYDQAQLLDAYTEAYQISGDEEFARVARDIANYVLRDLRSPQGGFYSAEDADSLPAPDAPRKLEGAFYVWKEAELRELLSPEESKLFCEVYGVEPGGNVRPESDPHGELSGQNVLFVQQSIETWAEQNGKTVEEARNRLEQVRSRLFAEREKRPRPHLDDKMITAWNGLMVAALARAGHILNEPGYIDAAQQAAAFVSEHLRDPDKNLLFRSFRTSRGEVGGFADDYAFFVSGLLALYETTGELGYLVEARDLQKSMEQRFWDGGRGGYFSAAQGDPALLIRMKEDHDGAEPSPNSVAFENLIRLADILKISGFREHAEHGLIAFASQMKTMGYAVPRMVGAFIWLQTPPRQIVFSGPADSSQVAQLRQVLSEFYDPFRVIAYGLSETDLPEPKESWKALSLFASEKPAAAVCRNFTCLEPVSNPEELKKQMVREE